MNVVKLERTIVLTNVYTYLVRMTLGRSLVHRVAVALQRMIASRSVICSRTCTCT
jgi:hypothetical protein